MPRRPDERYGTSSSRPSPCSTPSDPRRPSSSPSSQRAVAMLDAEPWIRSFLAAALPATPWTVLFFPHSGGSASSYHDLAARLAGTAQTACVQYPGRAERVREPLFTDVHDLADQVPEPHRPIRGNGALVLFGHSLGAAVAYEVVRRMPDQR